MTAAPRRNLNDAVTRFWGVAAPLYGQQFLQHWAYRPAQDEMMALVEANASRRVADIACGTGILADRIQRELHLDEVYGVDLGVSFPQPGRRTARVPPRAGPRGLPG